MKGVSRVCWQGDDSLTTPQMLTAGAVVWALFSLAQLVVNGVVLDETIVPAQIITNAVQYPGGHPHDVFYRTAYSLAHFLSAGMWAVIPDAIVISGFRNWLFLWTTAFAPFAVTLVITRKPFWAHVSVAFVLAGASLHYAGVYPMWIFPHYYSNGNIGLHVAVIAVALLAGGAWRAGALLVGLMPAIHATLSLAVWPWAALFFLFSSAGRSAEVRKQSATWFGLGIGLSVGLGVLVALLPASAAAVPPFVSGLDGPFRENFIALADVHRQPLPVWTMAYLTHIVLFAATSFYLWRHRMAESAWLICAGVLAWAIVYGAWGVQMVLGDLPRPVEIAMPWRFSNVSAVMLPALAVSAVALRIRSSDQPEQSMAGLAMLGLLLFTAVGVTTPIDLITRTMTERNILLLILGMLAGLELRGADGRAGSWIALLAMAVGIGTFWEVSKGLVYLSVTAGATWFAIQVSRRTARLMDSLHALIKPAILGAVLLVTVASVPHRSEDPVERGRTRWDKLSTADVELTTWLAMNAQPDEPVLTPFYPRAELQSKAGQVVLLELETLWIMTYMPSLAPLIGTMVMDLYGVDFRDGDSIRRTCGRQAHPWCSIWTDGWAARSGARWVELGEKYDFRLILAPTDVSLSLPPVWTEGHWRVYEIPRLAPAAEQ